MFDQFSRRFSTCKKIHIQQTSKSIEHVYMCTNTKIAKENKIERGRRELIFIGRTGGNEIIHSLFELFCCCRHRHCWWWWWLLLLFAFPQVPCTRDSISVGCDSHSSQSLFVLIVWFDQLSKIRCTPTVCICHNTSCPWLPIKGTIWMSMMLMMMMMATNEKLNVEYWRRQQRCKGKNERESEFENCERIGRCYCFVWLSCSQQTSVRSYSSER